MDGLDESTSIPNETPNDTGDTQSESGLDIMTKIKEPDAFTQCFAGKTIFITGVTGFLGKVLLEKLLRCFPEIKRIYVLMRDKRILSYRARLDYLFSVKLFDRVREEQPTSLRKVVPVCGDVSRKDLYLDESNLLLLREVNIIFNCAAVVRFDGPSRDCLLNNLYGTSNMLELAKTMPHLDAFIHVSTAYCFCEWKHVNEEIFPDIVQPESVLSSLLWMNNEQIDILCNMTNRKPTVYHYSKALAEQYLEKNKGNIPVVILRPSIITASWKEPFPGWVDTMYGPNGLILLCGKGMVRTLHVRRNLTADFVPVDVVVNALIRSARFISIYRDDAPLVVNCTSPANNRLSWGEMEKITYPILLKYPSTVIYRCPGGSFKKWLWYHRLCTYICHWFPAIFMDIVAFPIFREFSSVKSYWKIHKKMEHLQFFTTQKIGFSSFHIKLLEADLTEEDKKKFCTDMSNLNWNEYMDDYVLGLRRHILLEEDDTIPYSKILINKARFVWSFINGMVYTGAFCVVCAIYPPLYLPVWNIVRGPLTTAVVAYNNFVYRVIDYLKF